MKEKLKSLGYIIFGNILIAFAISTLVLENNVIAGGVTGFGNIVNHFTGASVTTVVFITNVTLFLLALFLVGKKFALTTLISTFLFPILLDFFEDQDILHHYCNDTLLASVLAGCLIGIGLGFILKSHASTGGVDIIAIIVNRKFNVPVFIILYIIDFFILILQITFSSTTETLYGFIVVFLTSFMLNKTIRLGKRVIQAQL